MKIYHYNPTTGQLVGTGYAKLSPLDLKQGREVYMIPSYATEIEPPEVIEGKILAFVDGAWTYYDIPTPITTPEPTESEILQMQIAEIRYELERLDREVPRILEDIIEQGNFTLHQSKLNIITRKIELRLQLQNLI